MDTKKILIIEDDYYVRELYERVLTKAGYEIITAADGQEGVQLVLQQSPSLILLDIMLPGKNGLNVLRQLKESDEMSGIPVIIMSNLGQDSVIHEAMEIGAAEYFLKPDIDPYEMAEKIKRFFENGKIEKGKIEK